MSELPETGRRIVFVHNTDSGLFNAIRERWQRAASPDTFPCHLSLLTCGVWGTNAHWRSFLDGLPFPARVLHRDTFRADYASSSWRNVDLPVVLLQTGRSLQKLVSADEIRAAKTRKQIEVAVTAALATAQSAAD
ncbi:MAG: hypothetical protein ACRDPG_13905 [Nocardioidaceae bacterium]